VSEDDSFRIRNTTAADFSQIVEMCREVYPQAPPWSDRQLQSHLQVFPEGQFVAERLPGGRVVGMAASLILLWDDYDVAAAWRDVTAGGMFTNHDPVRGRTLYGAEVMVRPEAQGKGVGKRIYAARRELVRRLCLPRIRAGARLRDYHGFADRMTAKEYVRRVVRGELADRTLTFQLRQGFRVLAVVERYLLNDPESLGYAAIIEWINEEAATLEDRRAVDLASKRFC